MSTTLNGQPTIEHVLELLEGVVQEKPNQWNARCPCHDDNRNSLSVGVGDDEKLLLHCHAGCSLHEIRRSLGLEIKDLFPQTNVARNGEGKTIVAKYDYQCKDGKLLFQSLRYEPKDFRQRRPDGKGGWVWKVKGCPVVPYRLPELLNSDSKRVVCIVEGEKDVDKLRSLGVIAICNAGGAGKWKDDHARYLKGRRVAILPDNDDAGRKHAEQVARSLQGIAETVRIVTLPDLPDKGDVSDWLDNGGTVRQLRELFDAADEWDEQADEPNPVPVGGRTKLTDMGNAERFAAQHGQDVRHIHKWNQWLCWTGKHWQVDSAGAVVRLAKQTTRGIFSEAAESDDPKEQKEIAAWASTSQSSVRIDAMLKLSRSELPIPLDRDKFDAKPWLLNFCNGTVDLKTGKLQPHSREDLLTKTTGIEFPTESTESALWLDFLQTVFDHDDEIIGFVQRLFGAALVGEQVEHILAILHGNGANGKSVFTSIMKAAMGSYAMTAPPSLLMSKRYDQHPTELADLFGKRLVVVSETRDGQRLDEGLVKGVTGGDAIRARRMREDHWEFMPSHLPVIATNHRPVVRGTDLGIWRRLRLIPFSVTIPPSQQDSQLTDKLRQELPAIARWLVQGCLEWQQDGLQEPEAVLAATDAYREESDTFSLWFEEHCVADVQAECKASKAYEHFTQWCERSKETRISQRLFGERLVQRFIRQRRKDGYHYLGFSLENST